MAENAKKVAGRQGGLARKDSLAPEMRKAIAQRAAAAKWGKAITSSKRGNFLDQLGMDVDCYVLDDAIRTAAISQRGMGKAIGLSERGNALPRFIGNKVMQDVLGAELSQKLSNPFPIQWSGGGAELPIQINGYDAALLIDLCKAIISAHADGKLGARYDHVAKQAALIVGASAKLGIKGLIYALAGYSPTTDEVIQAFKLYVLDEAKKYEKEFPQELYSAWQKLYQIAPIQRGRPWEFMHLTVNHIYVPLAKSNGKLLELLRALKARGGDRRKKLFQFLNDTGARALRMQIGRVLEMAEDAESKSAYEAKVTRRFGGQQEFDFVNTTDEPAAA